jgi:predicted site-specific integrase-resolvase
LCLFTLFINLILTDESGMVTELLKPVEVGLMLRYPELSIIRLAKKGQIPHIILPGGEIRFEKSEIERLIEQGRRRVADDR